VLFSFEHFFLMSKQINMKIIVPGPMKKAHPLPLGSERAESFVVKSAFAVRMMAVGALVAGALVAGTLAVGALAVGALVARTLAEGALVTGALVAGALAEGTFVLSSCV
jgi:hypothetical protein